MEETKKRDDNDDYDDSGGGNEASFLFGTAKVCAGRDFSRGFFQISSSSDTLRAVRSEQVSYLGLNLDSEIVRNGRRKNNRLRR